MLDCRAKGYLEFEAQIAYALTNNIGLISILLIMGQSTDKTGFDVGGGGGIELGAGYFSKRKFNI
ncbi:MAG: hypothetical protein IPP37_10900 [Saprospiraceae bacterium]|nr:hypothetical protein [Saprospiraceae bacterium]